MNKVTLKRGCLYRLGPQTDWHNEILQYDKRGRGDNGPKRYCFKRVLSCELGKFGRRSEKVEFAPPDKYSSIWLSFCYIQEIPLEELPLYLDWPHKYKALDQILKEM